MNRATLVILLILASTAGAQERPASTTEAPPHRWYCTGGSASRSNASSQVVHAAKLTVDWNLKLEQPLVAPALVWDQYIFLLESRPKERAIIKILDVESGLVVRRSSEFNCAANAKMGIWGRRIAIRTKANEVGFWSIGYRKVTRGMRIVSQEPIQDFLFYEGSVYATVGDSLVAYTLGYSKPRWQVKGQFRGEVAVAGGRVYATDFLGYAATLKCYDLTTGAMASSASITSFAESPAIDHPRPGTLQICDDLIVARLPNSRNALQKNHHQAGFILSRSINPIAISKIASSEFLGPAIAYDGRAIFRGNTKRAKNAVVMFYPKPRFFRPLISAIERSDLLVGPSAAVIRCGKTAWINDCAFLLDDHRMLRQGGEGVGAIIPMLGGMLSTSFDRTVLSALRDPAYIASQSKQFVGAAKGMVENGRVVFRNGLIVRGQFEYDKAANRISKVQRKGRKKDYELTEALYLEDARGHVVMAPSESLLLVGMKRLDDLDLADFYQSLAKDALRTNKTSLVDRLIDDAAAFGADEKEAAKLRKRLLSLKKRNGARVKPKIIDKIRQTEKDELTRVDERLWTRLTSLPAKATLDLKVKILRLLFAKSPDHKAAERLVNSWLPKKVQAPNLKRPASWLDFVVASRQTTIKIITPPKVGAELKSWDEGVLRSTQKRWRTDVVGIRSNRLFVISPLENPSQVVRCLALGETVCDALEKIFAGGKNRRSRPKPLVIHLFPTQEDYVKFGLKRGMRNVAATLGYYTTGENVTRLFLPDSEEKLESMRGTFVHELTHHWTFARCPLFAARDAKRSTFGNKGVWIAEGFADMMTDFIYNPDLRTFNTENPRARALDLVANAKDEQLLDWGLLLDTSHQHLMEFSTEFRRDLLVKLRWYVGGGGRLSPMNVFYSQSAAVCHYLMRAENGKYRPALLGFVAAYYQSRSDPWSPEKDLGMTAKELGKKVKAFAVAETRKKIHQSSK
ncbi:MAG: hypothetical protein ACI97A_001648 [Planctomycetota bacterium]|jgi:hypothetical protein